MATQTAFDEAPPLFLASASGAQFRAISAARAAEFLERITCVGYPSLRGGDAWGAFEDGTEMIAACAVARVTETSCRAQVAVVPERRHLGIGRELVDITMTHAARLGAQILRGSHRANAADAQGFIASLDVTRARRVHDGLVEVVIFIPTFTKSSQNGRP